MATTEIAAGLTTRLVEQVCSLKELGIDAELHNAACAELACLWAGALGHAADPAVTAVIRVGEGLGGRPATSVIGRQAKLDVLYGAMANGLIAQLGKLEMGCRASRLSAAAFGAAFALGRDRKIAGRSFISALVLGSEIETRVANAMGPSLREGGWDADGVCGAIGAALAGAVVCGLSGEQIASALGTAASSTVGLREDVTTPLEPFHAAKAAMNGTLACLLAEADFEGSTRVLEAPRGLFRVFLSKGEPEMVLSGLGSRWLLIDRSEADAWRAGERAVANGESWKELSESIRGLGASSDLTSLTPYGASKDVAP